MQTRPLGTGGPALSVIGVGCNNFGTRMDAEQTALVVHAALDAGVTHFDTAEMYGNGLSEEYLGAALVGRRDEAQIATKYTPRPDDEPYRPGVIASRIHEAVEGSLRCLGTDRIDVYYQHYPDPGPVDEALATLHELVTAGKVLHLANSNDSAAQLEEAATAADANRWTPFRGAQIHWSMLEREVEDEIVPTAERLGLGVVPYFPLASGLLTGKYRRGEAFPDGTRLAGSERFARLATEEAFDRVEAYTAFADARGHTVGELAIAWLLAQPSVTSVIAGATTPAQVAANAKAASWILTPEDVAALG